MKTLFQISLLLVFSAFWFVVLTTYIKEHTFHFQKPYERDIKTVMPEGWRFFTKSPRDFRYEAYVVSGSSMTPLSAYKHQKSRNASPYNWFGASRSARAMGGEMGLLMQKLPKENWLSFKAPPQAVEQHLNADINRTRDSLMFPRIINVTPGAYLEDSIIIVRSKPIPWAWIQSQKEIHYDYFPLHVICSQ